MKLSSILSALQGNGPLHCYAGVVADLASLNIPSCHTTGFPSGKQSTFNSLLPQKGPSHSARLPCALTPARALVAVCFLGLILFYLIMAAVQERMSGLEVRQPLLQLVHSS